MTILIGFATIEGQTGKIARHAADLLEARGLQVTLANLSDPMVDVSLEGAEMLILAASVHERRHPRPFEVFLTANADAIAARPTLMLTVSLSAAFPQGQEEAQDYLDEMKLRTGLTPDVELLVAGAVRARHYDYYAEQVVRHVILRGRDVDPNIREHEFTDWKAVDAALLDFVGEAPE